jgi:hypothetical protein
MTSIMAGHWCAALIQASKPVGNSLLSWLSRGAF